MKYVSSALVSTTNYYCLRPIIVYSKIFLQAKIACIPAKENIACKNVLCYEID